MAGEPIRCDVLIVGSGAAGLTCALNLPETLDVVVVSKSAADAGATAWAQGGIAAVLSEGDSVEAHIRDTLEAGAGLCHEDVVRLVVEHGPAVIARLIALGVPFTRMVPGEEVSAYHLTREGGHSRRRVIHVEDATGRALEDTLLKRIAERQNVRLIDNLFAVDLIRARHLAKGDDTLGDWPVRGDLPIAPKSERGRVHGAYFYDRRAGHVVAIAARLTVLATGGASRVYLYTSNPDGATGDGIAMAWRAGARVANMEFNQFHPTCLYHPRAKTFLISEALRGEGAVLTLPDGTRFMTRFDPRGELAPRDVVARAIDHEMKRLGLDHVLLDISHKDPDFVIGHFPNIYRRCLEFGLDITKAPIPVVPAAHYTCGGIVTDTAAHTDLPGLYAIGECAFTGLHGANRMASNSLLECLVFGELAAGDIAERIADVPLPGVPRPWDESRVTDSDEEIVVRHNWAELRRFMWDYVGIVRTDKRLERAAHRADLLSSEIQEYYGHFRVTPDLLELRNLVNVAELIIRSARTRKESRGLHYTLDYPHPLPKAVDTVLCPD